MKTHTICNKSKHPIVTFSKPFLTKIKGSSQHAFALMFTQFKSAYKDYTGKEITLDYLQRQELEQHFGKPTSIAKDFSAIDLKLKQVFEDGFMTHRLLMPLEESLEVADRFYKMLDNQL